MKYLFRYGLLLFLTLPLHAQDGPELRSWLRNTTGVTGYNNLPANVQQVRYSAGSVYINCSDIPAYAIGPWGNNPNSPTNQNFLFKFPRVPVANTGTLTATPLGPIALLINGVVVFDTRDANSYNNQNVWHSNAVVVEAAGMDACLGHAAPGVPTGGIYHHHQNPTCLHVADAGKHSGILGYAFDGFPIYGPYAFAGTDATGGITRMSSSYRPRAITERHTLADGTVLASGQYGPDVSTQYPIGYYVEDYEYVPNLGTLDAQNGRFAITPEYPAGIYAYYATIDEHGGSAYPYTVGPSYYGVVETANLTQHGHVTVSETVTTYTTSAISSDSKVAPSEPGLMSVYPNPASVRTTSATVVASLSRSDAEATITVSTLLGVEVLREDHLRTVNGVVQGAIDCPGLRAGAYLVRITSGEARIQRMMVIE